MCCEAEEPFTKEEVARWRASVAEERSRLFPASPTPKSNVRGASQQRALRDEAQNRGTLRREEEARDALDAFSGKD